MRCLVNIPCPLSKVRTITKDQNLTLAFKPSFSVAWVIENFMFSKISWVVILKRPSPVKIVTHRNLKAGDGFIVLEFSTCGEHFLKNWFPVSMQCIYRWRPDLQKLYLQHSSFQRDGCSQIIPVAPGSTFTLYMSMWWCKRIIQRSVLQVFRDALYK